MIVKNNDADQFVKHPPSEIAFFLVHGDDKGLVRERVAALIRGA
jgi:hypothetical protein